MNKDKFYFTNEYREMLDFILEQQEAALQYSDQLLSRKKDLEYKKKQQEMIQEERKKNRIPNISMFSPLNVEDEYDQDVLYKNEMDELVLQLSTAESAWEQQKKVCQSFERLKKFLYRMEQELQSNTKEDCCNLIDYSTKILETQEMDRNRISRDLHDSAVQSLTSLVHKTEYCSKIVDKDPVRVKLELQSMIDLNKEIINDMREIIYDLRPMSLNNIGLISTIQAYCLHLRRYDNLDVVLNVIGKERGLNSIVSVTLYRIIQEACNNAIRHAKSKKVIIRLSYMSHSIELDIEDDGIGFDVNKVESESMERDELHGFGLSTMKERARLLSGSFIIDSKPGAGTKIHLVVPVNYTSGEED